VADIDTEDTGLLSDRIRNALTDAISSGELAPGTTLDEQQLADRYGASRTPVREALRQLATSGMVEVRPRRGVIVRHVTADEVMDMFETMAELEAATSTRRSTAPRITTSSPTRRSRSAPASTPSAGCSCDRPAASPVRARNTMR
jgi:DNA-binding GntR family transcriptional regulator